MNRVLIIIDGPTIAYVCDKEVDVEVFDWDDYRANEGDVPPPHFKDLCEVVGVPFVDTVN